MMIRCPECSNLNPEGSTHCTLCQYDLTNYVPPAEEIVEPASAEPVYVPPVADYLAKPEVKKEPESQAGEPVQPLDEQQVPQQVPSTTLPLAALPAEQEFANATEDVPSEAPAADAPAASAPSADSSEAEPAVVPAAPFRYVHPVAAPRNPLPRPDGAIFADRFLVTSLIRSDAGVFRYQVRELAASGQVRAYQCQKCGAIQSFEGLTDTPCKICKTKIELAELELVLVESTAALPPVLKDVAAKGLVHPHILPPLAVFEETLAGLLRYCLVFPAVAAVPEPLDKHLTYHGFVGLAHAIDTLSANGISFKGAISSENLGFDHGTIVWSNFNQASIIPDDMREQARQDDLKGLLRLLKHFLLNNTQKPEPQKLTAVDELIAHADGPQGFRSGRELAIAFEALLKQTHENTAIDYRVGKATHVGLRRTLNEDSLYTFDSSRVINSKPQPMEVYLVADGMGGHTNGEVASGMIISYFSNNAPQALAQPQTPDAPIDWSIWLRKAIQGANLQVNELRRQTGSDMGSTVVMVLLDGLKAHIAHVGDSRAYLINKQSMRRITQDHSLVERLVATGQIQRKDVRSHPQRNVIYRTIGDKELVEPDLQTLDLDPGNKILLCSDGLWEMVDDETIFTIVNQAATPQDACDRLIEAANGAGGEDNITVVLVEAAEV